MKKILFLFLIIASFCTLSAQKGEKSIAVFVYFTEQENVKTTALRASMVDALLESTNEKYIIADRTEEILKLLKQEYSYQEKGYVAPENLASVGEHIGADKICCVAITNYGEDGFFFECSIVDVEKRSIEKGNEHATYPIVHKKDKKVTSLKIENSQMVAYKLASRLSLLSQDELLKYDNYEIERHEGVRKQKTAYVLQSFVPGLAQIESGKKAKGALFIAGEVLCIGGAVAMHGMGANYEAKIAQTNNSSYKQIYAHNADICYTTRNVMIGAAAAVYLWNIVDALANRPKDNSSFAMAPYAGGESFGVAMSFNF